MSATSHALNTVVATAIPQNQRLMQYPKYFGPLMLKTEATILSFAATISDFYLRNGTGYWDMYSLSNGGFYMAPRVKSGHKLHVVWSGNYFEADMSSDAFGIVVCLFSYNLIWESTQNDRFASLYHNLKDFSCTHKESSLILRAID